MRDADAVREATSAAWFGVLAPDEALLRQLLTDAAPGVSRVVLAAGWDQLQPRSAVLDTAAAAELVRRCDQLQAAGYEVVLDPGLQYPPAWVFALPGPTRFVNQHGRPWRGRLSEDVPNAVFNPAVRVAQRRYLDALAGVLTRPSRGPGRLVAVRVGGLGAGELRLPPGRPAAGSSAPLWCFDELARQRSPVPGWRPGTGGAAAEAMLRFALDALAGYLGWLLRATASAFVGLEQQVLFPGWGLRPGMVEEAVATGVRGASVAERNGILTEGSDWAAQVAVLAQSGVNGVVHTTWLDAPQQAPTAQGEPPVRYLAALAARHGLPVTGENSASGAAVLRLCRQRATDLRLAGMLYFCRGPLPHGDTPLEHAALLRAATQFEDTMRA